ncbi:Phosphate transport system permease protein PstC (TC 3.A.1.7.1) [hydrothermal vent metagenome]|uniref:Phosphate transport system permease protein PstC (TC 3.A.1.7.1) n=1 Tax=hydrothermal vent metagenome TaxID=652676 RepID=A0A3B0YCF9_9ZZZZ
MSEANSNTNYGASIHLRMRLLKDRLARYAVAIGGNSVIAAILLIFIYLLYVVLPLGDSPEMHRQASYSLAVDAPVEYIAMEEQAEIGVVIDHRGLVRFIATEDGKPVDEVQLAIPKGVSVVSFSAARPSTGIVALGLSNGQVWVVQPHYEVSFPKDVRVITPSIRYPLGHEPIILNSAGLPLVRIGIQEEESYTLVGWSADGTLSMVRAQLQESLLGDEGSFEFESASIVITATAVRSLLIDPTQRNLYVVATGGALAWYDLSDFPDIHLHEQVHAVAAGVQIIDAELLAGGSSIMVAGNNGVISQWFSVRDDEGVRHLEEIRDFSAPTGLTSLVPEFGRKAFLAAAGDGSVTVYHATAHQQLMREAVADTGIKLLAVAPRANALWALDDNNRLHFWSIHNEHPEISWEALWSKVWYEGYDKPDYIWQSSAADNDFEPKFSLTPLTFGTLKAAFYAMLFAIPLSIFGAIFTAYFMAPKMRRMVKPSIEIMEALPTVILGFLAGLWLAPLIETHLPGIFALFILLPIMVLVFAFLWHLLPVNIRSRIPDGWEAALLIPGIAITVWATLALSPLLELWLFKGDMPGWLETELGIGFDQRNSLVVGLAMGFAIIPTIFSIAEDAIFSVPRYLTNGSLALGATPWQTLVRVVLLTASPGIFSAIMMGVGRAVGETMIVLMATGNTPVMDLSIFQGMRTLSANIAVEMPEAEVASTHYRVLFLAALVLFAFTFVFNTVAELIRQRLRSKYSSL